MCSIFTVVGAHGEKVLIPLPKEEAKSIILKSVSQ